MSKQLLTYQEFKNVADFTDNVTDGRFNKYEKISEETYLRELIGDDLVTAIKAGTYDELIPYVKNCLAHEIELYFMMVGSIVVTGIGAVQRDSTYSKDPQWTMLENKINMVKDILRRYETLLRETIEVGDYTDYNDETAITKKVNFTMTSVGD